MKKNLSILLLDDNPATNFIHKKFFQSSGRVDKVIEFQSGLNALSHLARQDIERPDMIFVDINMPIMNAWEFMQEYQKMEAIVNPETIIILLSTSLSPKDEERIKEFPLIRDIILKPLSVGVIRRITEKYFD